MTDLKFQWPETIASLLLMQKKFTAIIAVDKDFLIGFNSTDNCRLSYRLPWSHSMQGDLEFFRKTTSRACLLMGRKTAQSIGRILPNRYSIIFSRQEKLTIGNQLLASGQCFFERNGGADIGKNTAMLIPGWQQLPQTLEFLRASESIQKEKKIFIIGGAELLATAAKQNLICECYLTCIAAKLSGEAKPNETPIYLPDILRRQLQKTMDNSEPFCELAAGERNRYNAQIYYLSL